MSVKEYTEKWKKEQAEASGGLAGAGCNWDFRKRSFGSLLSGPHPIVIPLFQRRYCWPSTQVEQWFRDIVAFGDKKAARDSGQSVFKLNGEALVCVDGQQRLTTTQLLLVSLRDAVLAELRCERNPPRALLEYEAASAPNSTEHACIALVEQIDAMLFRNVRSMRLWARTWAEAVTKGFEREPAKIVAEASAAWAKMHQTGYLPSFEGGAVLTPCYLDRAPFMEMLTAGVCKHELLALYGQGLVRSSIKCDAALPLLEKAIDHAIPTASACSSFQGEAKTIFDRQVLLELLARVPPLSLSNRADRVGHLRHIVESTLNNMTLTYMEALHEVNFGRAFLWLQEKAILSDKALLCNSRPGMRLRLLDLVRNLLLSITMNRSLSEQEAFYHQRWLKPLEFRLGTDALDKAVASFVRSHCQDPQRHMSTFEQQVQARCRTFQEAAADFGPAVAASNADHGSAMHLYAQFYSLAESCQLRKGQRKVPAEEGSVTGAGEIASKRARHTNSVIADETLQDLLVQLTAFVEDYARTSAALINL